MISIDRLIETQKIQDDYKIGALNNPPFNAAGFLGIDVKLNGFSAVWQLLAKFVQADKENIRNIHNIDYKA